MHTARAKGTTIVGALFLVLVALTLVVVLIGRAEAATTSIKGRFTSQPVTGPTCESPVGVCTTGVLTGNLKGTFRFTATSLIQSADTPTTGVVFYTGDIVIQTKEGALFCKDAGALQTTGAGAVASVCTLTGGTGAFQGASGTIQFIGTFTSAAGGAGDYQGSLSTP